MQSIGKQLAEARMAHGWSVEDVAFQTHIPAARIRDLESDDLSRFANLTYAKGFLKLYSRHVNLDIDDYLDQFDTRALSNATGREYARAAGSLHVISSASVAPRQGNGMAAAWILLGVLVVMAFAFLKWRSGGDEESGGTPPESTRQVPGAENDAATGDPILPDDDIPLPPETEAPVPRAAPIPEDEEPALDSILPPVPRPANPDARAAG